MLKVITDIMEHCYNMWNTMNKAINLCNGKKMNSALMFLEAIIMDENVLIVYYS